MHQRRWSFRAVVRCTCRATTFAGYEGRFELWDADTEITMVCEPTTAA